MDDDDREEFAVFARQHWPTLMAIATAVSASPSGAEDLVQTALAGAFARWPDLRQERALGYLRRSIVNANVSRWRRTRGREVVLADVPDIASRPEPMTAVDDRHSVVPLVRALPAGQRAVIVLRYLADLPDDVIAETLGISPVTVRSRARRGLAALRTAIDHQTTEEVLW